jgi:hypothetical protein
MFHKMQEIFRPAERISDSYEGLCFLCVFIPSAFHNSKYQGIYTTVVSLQFT